MAASIDGGSRIRPPMPHQSAEKYRGSCVKMTRLGRRYLSNRPRSATQLAAPNYRRPLKTGNIVQTCVNALMAGHPRLIFFEQESRGCPQQVRGMTNEGVSLA